MAHTHEAKDEPEPSALSHMVRKASIVRAPENSGGGRVLLDLAGVEGEGHGGHEEAGLAVEVVVDQGGVHARLTGHRPQAGPVVALRREDPLGRFDDLAPSVGVARPAADGAHRAPAPCGGDERVFTIGEFTWYNSSMMNHRLTAEA